MSTEEHIAQLTAQVAALQAKLARCTWPPPPPQAGAAPAPTPKPPNVGTPCPIARPHDDRDHFKAEWGGGPSLGWVRGGDRGSTGLGWGWRPAAMSKLGLEGCNLCCQLGDVLLSGHGGVLARGLQGLSFLLLSGCIQDQEHTQCPGACGAPTYLQGVTQGEWVPAECLSRSVIIMYKSKYIHKVLYLSRSDKKAAFSSYSSPALYNVQVTWRKELNKKAVTCY